METIDTEGFDKSLQDFLNFLRGMETGPAGLPRCGDRGLPKLP